MKLLTMRVGDTLLPGMAIGDEVLDIAAAAEMLGEPPLPASLKAILALGDAGLARLRTLVDLAATKRDDLRAAGALTPWASVTLAPVIPDPDLVLSGAMNSRGHLEEMHDPLPEHPIAFQKLKAALHASGQDIVPPPDHPAMIDWEGELCVVIGKPCYRVTPETALDHVVGYTLMNDVSAREFVKDYVDSKTRPEMTSAWDRLIAGKNFPTFCPVGPVIVTADDFDGDYHMETLVNGEVMQSSTPADLVFTIAEFITYFSRFYAFAPGDIISMGSPPGVGMARRPQRFLKPGDTVEVRERRIGSLVNGLASPDRSSLDHGASS